MELSARILQSTVSNILRQIQAEEMAGVGLSDGRDFAGAGWVRLNFGCPRATLDEALRRMAAAVAAPA